VKSLKIDPDVIDPDDLSMVEDLVIAAVNEALQQVQSFQTDQLSGLTGGLNIPGLSGAPEGGGGGPPMNRAARRAQRGR
jgi:DNA-binding protein YbaB